MYNGKTVCAFVANDAGKYAFKRLSSECLIDSVVTIDEKKAIKLGVSNYLDVKKFFKGKTYYAKKYSLNSKDDLLYFERESFDLGFILGWNRLIPEDIIKTFKIGIFGFHGSPFELPKGRGRSPSIWAIALGFKNFKFHMFKVDPGVDSGEIYGVRELEINETDDIKIFHYKTSIAVYELIKENIDRIINNEQGITQSGKPVYFRKRSEKDGKINWNLPTNRIYDLIRAITKPYPGAWTTYKGEKLRIWRAVPFTLKLFQSRKPGEVCAVFDDAVIVKTKDGTIAITDWEPRIRFEEGGFLT